MKPKKYSETVLRTQLSKDETIVKIARELIQKDASLTYLEALALAVRGLHTNDNSQ